MAMWPCGGCVVRPSHIILAPPYRSLLAVLAMLLAFNLQPVVDRTTARTRTRTTPTTGLMRISQERESKVHALSFDCPSRSTAPAT